MIGWIGTASTNIAPPLQSFLSEAVWQNKDDTVVTSGFIEGCLNLNQRFTALNSGSFLKLLTKEVIFQNRYFRIE